ncbi:MAG: hypothetical protein U1G07_08520 [Verrucomicrobiota bacterium]
MRLAIPAGDIPAGAFGTAATFVASRAERSTSVWSAQASDNQRLPIILRPSITRFVGPDNGLLSLAASQDRIKSIYASPIRRDDSRR